MRERAQRQRTTMRPKTGRRRAALVSAAQSCVAVVACTLWVALALPGLQLLPGLGNDGDASVAISLQSALLGIDDLSAKPANAQLRASLRALGIDPAHGSLSAALSRTQSAAAFAPLIAQVDTIAAPSTDVSAATASPIAPPDAPQITALVARVHTSASPRVVRTPRAPVPPVRPPVTTPPVTAPPAPPPPVAPTGQTIIFTSLRTDEVTRLRKEGVSLQTPQGKKWLQLLPVPAPPSETPDDAKS